ncbi:ParA family protein [Lactovum miscens]|uniref:Chromosome partitioning protein n=1 Tax=Lactovum miscens TaxID=190387 RepID=A0A841C7Q1_9LACT|nr:ParA family protein [Lactovum miscens]MBB5887622.1 chromosome partitioning protein [Lactovum miscens]
MKILTINVNKGGAGKTTLAHNLAEYFALDSKVLLFDFDDSANLTHRYEEFDGIKNTVIKLFDGGVDEPIKLSANLSLYAGSSQVEQLKEQLNSRRRREYLFGKWLGENYDRLESEYDYLVIDTENDEGILTVNALIATDMVLGIAEASKDSVTALGRLKKFVSEINQDFERNITLKFVANKINFAETASKDLLDALESYPEYLGYLPRRTVLANDVALVNQPFNKVDDETYAIVIGLFETIKQELDKAGEDGE